MKGIGINQYGNENQLTVIELEPPLGPTEVKILIRVSGIIKGRVFERYTWLGQRRNDHRNNRSSQQLLS
ncbi:hypothetical protein [Shouchella shacheensis]|uniref:hypothetical protein n=1 Tax=Shouchella shacheensis TaxID=1649580 RepID=UPI00073FEBD1|nr:hypothetical protein [Shouchella shacheensis]